MKNFLIFLAGLGLGGGLAFLFTRNYYKKLLDILEEDKGDKAFEDAVREQRAVKSESKEDMVAYVEELLSQILTDEEKEDYYISGLEKMGVGVTDMRGDYEEEYESVNPVEEDEDESPSESPDIYKIEESIRASGGYDQLVIFFYEDDSTFVLAENDYVIDNWRQRFGSEIFNWIEDHNWRKNNLYIRNDSLEEDYEIVLKEGAYNSDDEELGNFRD